MLGGYMGKILLVDLTQGTTKEEPLEEETYRSFIGGAGLGAKVLYEHMKAGVDPLGPENWLGFVTGPLTGTNIPLSARFTAVAKSPLTDTWGEANSGGYWGAELKTAGYDAVFFSGVSSKPVYLWIDNGSAELRDAADLWGMDTAETTQAIQDKLGDPKVRVACIGPAGEMQSLLSSIIVDRFRAMARMGLGAVMGSKKLKAVAVRGTKKVPVANTAKLKELRDDFMATIKASKYFDGHSTIGTSGGIERNLKGGSSPVKNWSLIGGEAMPSCVNLGPETSKRYWVKKQGCFACPVACGAVNRVESAPYQVDEARRPEYETLASFGTMCLNDNFESIVKAGDICDRYGMDTISAGTVIALPSSAVSEVSSARKSSGT